MEAVWLPIITVSATPLVARALLSLARSVSESDGVGDVDLSVERVGPGRNALLISRLPASVDSGALLDAVAHQVLAGHLIGVRSIHDESDPEHGTRVLIEIADVTDQAAVTEDLLSTVRSLHETSREAVASLLEALAESPDERSGTLTTLSVDDDLATILQRTAEDMAWACNERGDETQQALWDSVGVALNRVSVDED